MARFSIADLVPRAEGRGLAVLRFPFHDGGIPRDLAAATGFVGARGVMQASAAAQVAAGPTLPVRVSLGPTR